MPKCPLASHSEKPISKQGKYKVKLEYLFFYFSEKINKTWLKQTIHTMKYYFLKKKKKIPHLSAAICIAF